MNYGHTALEIPIVLQTEVVAPYTKPIGGHLGDYVFYLWIFLFHLQDGEMK